MEAGEQQREVPVAGYKANGAVSARAASAYNANTFEGLGQRELMAEAARMMTQKLILGRDSYRIRKYDDMAMHHSKVFSILALLMQTLVNEMPNMDAPTQKVARDTLSFYKGFNRRLVIILKAKSVEDEFAELIDEMTKFYRLWSPRSAEPAAPAAAANDAAAATSFSA